MSQEDFMHLLDTSVSAFEDEPQAVKDEFVRQIRNTGVGREQITALLVQTRLERKKGQLRPTMANVLAVCRSLAAQAEGKLDASSQSGSLRDWYRRAFSEGDRHRLASLLPEGFAADGPCGMMITDIRDGIVREGDIRACLRQHPDDPGGFVRMLIEITEPRRSPGDRYKPALNAQNRSSLPEATGSPVSDFGPNPTSDADSMPKGQGGGF